MGLDMYLTRKTYVKNWDHMKPSERHVITVKHEDGSPSLIDTAKISYIIEEVGYWRKANQIHNWFVQNVQDGKDECQNSYVASDKLKELLDLCKKVKANKQDAPALLPSKPGFFFGGIEYDEYYMEDIDATIAILEPLLKEETNGEFYYHASW